VARTSVRAGCSISSEPGTRSNRSVSRPVETDGQPQRGSVPAEHSDRDRQDVAPELGSDPRMRQVRGEARLSAAQEPQRWRLASKRLIAFVVTDMAMLVRDDVVRTV